MLSVLLISCAKTIVIDTTTAVKPTVNRVNAQEQMVDPIDLNLLPEHMIVSEERPKQSLGYPEAHPKHSHLYTHQKPIEPFNVRGPENELLVEGSSLWWSFTQETDHKFSPPNQPGWEWIWHSPTLLELKPTELRSSELVLPAMSIQSHAGETLEIPRQSWEITPLHVESTHFFESEERLELCLNASVSEQTASTIFQVKTHTDKLQKITVLPSENAFSSHCEGPSLGIRFDSKSHRLVDKRDAQTIYENPIDKDGITISCEAPCTMHSPVTITNLPHAIGHLRTNRKWSDVHLEKSSDTVRIVGHKSKGKHRIQLDIDGKHIEAAFNVVSAPHRLDLPHRFIRPVNGKATFSAEGQWTSTLYHAEPNDWKPFIQEAEYYPTVPPVQVRTDKANNGRIELRVPNPNHNYIVQMTSGTQTKTAWLLPESLTVEHLSAPKEDLLLVSNSEGPIIDFTFQHSSGILTSSGQGHLKVTPGKVTEESHLKWQGIWHPIIQNSTLKSENYTDNWQLYLDQSTIYPGRVLSVYGWSPKPNSTLHWSVASNEQMDVLSGQSISGQNGDIELKIPLPTLISKGDYQLRFTQDLDTHTVYFSIDEQINKPTIHAKRTSQGIELIVQSTQSAHHHVSIDGLVAYNNTEVWDQLGTFWLPNPSMFVFKNSDERYNLLRVTLTDINGKQQHQEKILIPHYPSDYELIYPSLVFEKEGKIEFKLRANSLTNVNPNQTWTVEHNGRILCKAQMPEPCLFTSPSIGLINLISKVDQTVISNVALLVLGDAAKETVVIAHQEELAIQARSQNATAHLYLQSNGKWISTVTHTNNGHIVMDIPKHSTCAAVEIWDAKGRAFHKVNLEPTPNFQTVIEDGRIKAIGTIPRSGLILKDVSNPKKQTALGPVKIGESGSISWTLPKNPSIRKIQVYGLNESASKIHDTVSLVNKNEFRVPQEMRLLENAFAELILHNPLDTPQRFHFQLMPTKSFKANDTHSGSITVDASSHALIKIRLSAILYGVHSIELQVHGEQDEQVLKQDITVLQSSDDTTHEEEFYVDVSSQGRVAHHKLDGEQIAFLISNVEPSLDYVKAVRPFYEAPPNNLSKVQLVWVGNAFWDALAHGRDPERTKILDQITRDVLEPPQRSNSVDSLLWDLALLQSIHNGVTPPMIEVVNRLHALPYQFDLTLSIEVLDTLNCLQYWAFALAQSSLYKGVAPELPEELEVHFQQQSWMTYPVIAQSILLEAARLNKDRALQRSILQHWAKQPNRLHEPLPSDIGVFFDWPPASSTNSVRWALFRSAPKSELVMSLKPQSVIQNGDMWAALAAASRPYDASYNLSTLLAENRYLIQDGRYHSFRTVPISHQAWIDEPTQWQIQIFGKGRQYYTIGHHKVEKQSAKSVSAHLQLLINTEERTFQEYTNEFIFEQHQLYHVKLVASGLQPSQDYWLHWPSISGFNTAKVSAIGGQVLERQGPWIRIRTTGSVIEIVRKVSPSFTGQFRLPPLRWYSSGQVQPMAQTQSFSVHIKSEDEYHLEPLPDGW